MQPQVPPGPFPGTCAHMAYVPRTRPAFPGDLQHDFRDYMLDQRLGTLADWHGEAADCYLRAARLTGVAHTDPIAVCLAEDDVFDARTIWVAHDHMAAHWRATCLEAVKGGREGYLVGPDLEFYCQSYAGLLFLFRAFLRRQVALWATAFPEILWLFCRAVTGEHTMTGQETEAALGLELYALYPVPGGHDEAPSRPHR